MRGEEDGDRFKEAEGTVQESLHRVLALKEEGNAFFREKRPLLARAKYQEAWEIFDEQNKKAPVAYLSQRWLLAGASLLSNLAAISMNANVPYKALEELTEGMRCLYRRDQAGRRLLPFFYVSVDNSKTLLWKILKRRLKLCEDLASYGWIIHDLELVTHIWGKDHAITKEATKACQEILYSIKHTDVHSTPQTSKTICSFEAPYFRRSNVVCAEYPNLGDPRRQTALPLWLFGQTDTDRRTGRHFYFGGEAVDSATSATKFAMVEILSSNMSLAVVPITQKGPVPSARRFGTLVAHNDRLYLWGGYPLSLSDNNKNGCCDMISTIESPGFDDLWVCDLRSYSWRRAQTKVVGGARQQTSPVASMFHSSVLAETGSFADNPAIIIHGGGPATGTGFSPPDTWKFDIRSGEWSMLLPAEKRGGNKRSQQKTSDEFRSSDFPRPAACHASWIWKNRMYIFGGMTAADPTDLGDYTAVLHSDLTYFDFNAREWHALQLFGNVPSPRTCCGMASIDGGRQVVIVGGYVGLSGMLLEVASGLSQTVWPSSEIFIYDCPTNIWTQVYLGQQIVPWMSSSAWICALTVESPRPNEDMIALFGGTGLTLAGRRSLRKGPMELLPLNVERPDLKQLQRAEEALYEKAERSEREKQEEAGDKIKTGKKVEAPPRKPSGSQLVKPNSQAKVLEPRAERKKLQEETDQWGVSSKDGAEVLELHEALQNEMSPLMVEGELPTDATGPWAYQAQPYDPYKELGGCHQQARYWLRDEEAAAALMKILNPPSDLEACMVVTKFFGTRKAARLYFDLAKRLFFPVTVDTKITRKQGLPREAELCNEYSARDCYSVVERKCGCGIRASKWTIVCLLVIDRLFAKLTFRVSSVTAVSLAEQQAAGWKQHVCPLLDSFITYASECLGDYGSTVRCWSCNKRTAVVQVGKGSRVKVCGRCKLIRFCSEDCQRKSHAQHRQLCLKRDVDLADHRPKLPPHGGVLALAPEGSSASNASIRLETLFSSQPISLAAKSFYVRSKFAQMIHFSKGPNDPTQILGITQRAMLETFPWCCPVIFEPGERGASVIVLFICFFFPRGDNTVGQLVDMLREAIKQHPVLSKEAYSQKLDALIGSIVAYGCSGQLVHADRTIREVAEGTAPREPWHFLRFKYLWEEDLGASKGRSAWRRDRLSFANDRVWSRQRQ